MDTWFKNEPLYHDAKQTMKYEFRKKREEGVLSKAHAEDHVLAVSNFGAATASALMKGTGRESDAGHAAFLASLAGLMHDIRREATEKSPHGPEGAKFVLELSWEDGHTGYLWKSLGPDGFDAVYRAIANHEYPFKTITTIFGDPLETEGKPLMPSVVSHSLKTGDAALEASGYRVIERRSFFVGKERFKKDLKDILKYPDESHLAFLGETMIRLYKKNPIDAYPEWLKPFAEEWHAIQYLFYSGLLRYTGMDEKQAAEYMHRIGFTKFDQELVDKISQERHLDGNYFPEDKYPVLSSEIKKLRELPEEEKDDLAESAYRTVRFIAEAESPEEAIGKYQKEGMGDLEYANEFMEGIIAYRSGSEEFLDDFERKIEESVRALKGV